MTTGMGQINLSAYQERISRFNPIRVDGKVSDVIGLVIQGYGKGAFIGERCDIVSATDQSSIVTEVVGFKGDRILLMPLGNMEGIAMGCPIIRSGQGATMNVGHGLLGRVIDGLGQPIDGGPPTKTTRVVSLYRKPLNPMKRKHITEPLDLGVGALNSLLTVGKGQRLGIMAGSGVGKSVLLGMMARNTTADVNVIGLIGERGREVANFVDKILGTSGLENSVVIAATSDQPPLIRMRGAFLATAIAEYFREQGADVLLVMDSITRFAMAQREVSLAIGEPPTTKGYTPSVFATLPRLLERAGLSDGAGSITGLYTVLIEGDDIHDPVGDSVRSIVDGHIVLSRELACRGHYPAIDVLASSSRLMPDITSETHIQASYECRQMLADYHEAADLVNIGAYQHGSNPKIDRALSKIDSINQMLTQGMKEKYTFDESLQSLMSVVRK